MSEQTPKPPKKKDTQVKDHTQKLDKAIEEISSGRNVDGTLVSIEAHTGEHQMPPERPASRQAKTLPPQPDPSVSEALKRAKRGKSPRTPDIQPAQTMYEPTRPGQVSAGSSMATQHGPTGGPSASQTPSASGGANVIAPFGGKIMVGTRVGQIEVTGVLGKGGMGEVFKGYHHALDINVAVKVLPDELSRNELVRQRFLREARLCVKLDHPHIVRVFNVDEHTGNLFLVMEMIEGTDSANMLKNGGRFRYKRALEIGAASAEALAYAHSQGLVHRDVKPHNILLGREDGKIKLSDFGLARAATSSSHLTMSGQIMGTPHYMSPEQAEAKEVTDKSDVYSLGVTLYHMLTGETPFVGDTPISVAVQHIAKEILFPEARFAPFPKELTAVLKRMTAKDPAKRCSAKQAAVWLRKLMTMASEDIQAPADAMNTLAPVVRESQAFEAAAKERENRDEQAREQARTMLATVREPRQPSGQMQQPEWQPGSNQYQAQPEPAGGKGKLVAAALVVLLLGGGAGWYFGLGGKEFVEKQGWLASSPTPDGGTTGGATGGTTGGTTGGGTTGGTTGGGTTGGTGGAASGTTGGDTGGPIGPPPDKDDKTLQDEMDGVLDRLGTANTITELDQLRSTLNNIRLYSLSRGSQSQRDQFKEVEERYKGKYAITASADMFKRMADGVQGYEGKRVTDLSAAISELNIAIKARDEFKRLEVPAVVESEIRDERDRRLKQVEDAYNDVASGLRREIADLRAGSDPKKYELAEKKLDLLIELEMPESDRANVRNERSEIRTLNQHTKARAEIRDNQFKTARDTLDGLARVGYPKAMEEQHRTVVEELNTAVAAAFDKHVAAADAAIAANNFSAARDAYDKANELSKANLLTTGQRVKLTNESYASQIREALYICDTSINTTKFSDAQKHLSEAQRLVAEKGDIALPETLLAAATNAKSRYDAELERHFAALLEEAQKKLDTNDFANASKLLVEADELPLTPDDQRKRLDDFKNRSQSALASYVRQLIADIDTALNKNDFEGALTALKQTNALDVPLDMAEKLAGLKSRFETEAVSRMKELLDRAEKAVSAKRYEDARGDLDKAGRIPIEDPALVERRGSLETAWLEALGGDVEGRMGRVDALLDAEEFKSAKTELDAAAQIARHDTETARVVSAKRKAWAERVQLKLADLLKQAEESWKADNFKQADAILAEAAKLSSDQLLDQAQILSVSQAGDARDKALDAYIDRLFKDLEGWVRAGREDKGNEVIAKLGQFTLGPGRQSRLNKLKVELTGENPARRREKLPEHLRSYFGDKYFSIEQSKSLGRDEVTAVSATNDGKWGIAGTSSGKVYFYNLKRGSDRGDNTGGSRKITAVAFSPDGTTAVSGDDDGQVVVFNVTDGGTSAMQLGDIDYAVNALVYSNDGRMVYALARNGTVWLFNPVARQKVDTIPTGLSPAQSMALSPDGRTLAVGGDDSRVSVFNATDRTLRKIVIAPGSEVVRVVAFTADSKYLIAGSEADKIGMWDVGKLSEKPLMQYKGLGEFVLGAGFSIDGRAAVAFDTENKLIVWDRAQGIEKRSLAFDKLRAKDEREWIVSAGFIGPDGTGLMGTRSGRLIHFTFGSGG